MRARSTDAVVEGVGCTERLTAWEGAAPWAAERRGSGEAAEWRGRQADAP